MYKFTPIESSKNKRNLVFHKLNFIKNIIEIHNVSKSGRGWDNFCYSLVLLINTFYICLLNLI
ncbi:MAG: hypothetical protein EB100_02340 [Crocinitomicaceae bacterium]|nr:hypothetical protein [Crocinitomicaceae bacterium]